VRLHLKRYVQCGYVFKKGGVSFGQLRQLQGLSG